MSDNHSSNTDDDVDETSKLEIHRAKQYVTARDIYEWRRKDLSMALLLVATAIWVVMELYQINFIPFASWLLMLLLTAAFLLGNIIRLFGKETPSMSGVEISEEAVLAIANTIRERYKEWVRWMFRVGAEAEWFVFTKTVAALWLLSFIGTFTDLITFLYIGTVLGMTAPVLHAKYGYKFREYQERIRVQCKRVYVMIDDKVIRKVRSRMAGAVHDRDQIKERKTE